MRLRVPLWLTPDMIDDEIETQLRCATSAAGCGAAAS